MKKSVNSILTIVLSAAVATLFDNAIFSNIWLILAVAIIVGVLMLIVALIDYLLKNKKKVKRWFRKMVRLLGRSDKKKRKVPVNKKDTLERGSKYTKKK